MQTTSENARDDDQATDNRGHGDAAIQPDNVPAGPGADMNRAPEYETYPEVYFAEMSKPDQLPQVVLDRNNFPQVVYGDQPEAFNVDDSGPEAVQERPKRTFCGLKKTTFWTLVVVILLVVLIVSIAGGIVGSRATTPKHRPKFLPTTALAAVNYTDYNGLQYRRVYFQADSNELFQTTWDSASREWKVSPLNPRDADGPDIKPGTPLAAYIYNVKSQGTLEYHVFFLDRKNKLWERGCTNGSDMWGKQTDYAMNGTFAASGDTKIAVYADGCDNWCATTSVVVWQNASGLVFAGFATGWYPHEVNATADRPIPIGGSLSLSPVWSYPEDGSLLNLYANTGTLSKFVFNTSAHPWEAGWSYDNSYTGSVSDNASIASFIQGYNGENNTSSDVEVLATKPGTRGGGISWWDSNSNSSAREVLSSSAGQVFSQLSNFSNIAATAGGSVFAVEGGELVEWEWQHDTRSFNRSGVVNTTINS